MHMKKLAKRASVLEQPLDDEVVLLDPASGRHFGLDAAGARAWLLLVETGDTARVQAQLLSEWRVATSPLGPPASRRPTARFHRLWCRQGMGPDG